MNNMDRFNQTSAALFKLLYENFPDPIVRFDVESLREAAGLPPPAPNAQFSDMGGAVKWLAEEGFIRYSKQSFDRHFFMIVLSNKGLEAMNRVPDSLTPKLTIGERLKQLGRETSLQAVGSLVQFAISGAGPAIQGLQT